MAALPTTWRAMAALLLLLLLLVRRVSSGGKCVSSDEEAYRGVPSLLFLSLCLFVSLSLCLSVSLSLCLFVSVKLDTRAQQYADCSHRCLGCCSWVMSWNTTNTSCTYWQRHLHLESAYQMGYMRWLFEVGIAPTHWSTLHPAPHRLVEAAPGGATNPTAAIALAQSVKDGTVVAYLLPANNRVVFEISQPERHHSATPFQGRQSNASARGLWWSPSSNSTEAGHCESASHSLTQSITVGPGDSGGSSSPSDSVARARSREIVTCGKPPHWEDAVLIYR